MIFAVIFLAAMVMGLIAVWADYRPVPRRETHDRGGHVYRLTEDEWKSR